MKGKEIVMWKPKSLAQLVERFWPNKEEDKKDYTFEKIVQEEEIQSISYRLNDLLMHRRASMMFHKSNPLKFRNGTRKVRVSPQQIIDAIGEVMFSILSIGRLR